MVNGNEVNDMIVVYSSTVEAFLKYLSGWNKQIEVINESSRFSNICALPKTR